MSVHDYDVSGDDSAISTARASDVLDREPQYSRREAADEDIPEPTV